ncbi:MAG: bifunctional (p)ppGpp synthetase/guanosine-3',5'-bis(diphosphate) 3'-pyrophosphohydrolase [Candidatus Izemoplasmatales bacterium]|nr:bifunctional (p)ppGpp synthetase/guanosine-3',5'-bis(diphosphate) 3'-pyrophosphohydrolase [Candidatus Izemoplasmatales bacterium]MDY0139676.1 bifunctional (p)ppGpp synthetase/guanosine-3',5'-bis(diphosphate) 3'-pyrophosphohydrolase [Candidatus Izemoplasmatales bacterium]
MPEVDYYKPLLREVRKYIAQSKHLDFIRSAFDYAEQAHHGQLRKSGEPYIVHPRDVAITLAEYEVDPNTLVAGLLHDIIEDTDTTYDEIKEKFGEEVADIVEGLTKLDQLKYQISKAAQQVKNHQKMVLAMARDIRVIFVKLADRLNNMRTLAFLDDERRTRISRETLDVFAPIAHRLGMYRLKAELEDLSFKYLYPFEYQKIARLLRDKKGSREADVEEMKRSLSKLLTEEKFDFDVKGRIKNIHSVYSKMKVKKIDFEEIHDLLALRIIVNTISDCYKAIGIVHSRFIPVPGRFKDYIAMPKPNMYQSLHTTVVNKGKIFEIQIRTNEMDEIAEKGVAAHWAYKESKGMTSRKNIEDLVTSKLRWYSELIKYTEENDNDEEILDIFTDDILKANVYVFTPKGEIIDLTAGATPLDFAFRIHTKVGEKTVGAIVNGKIRPLDYTLKTGDLVEIKTSPNSVGPNDNWLKIAKTSNARSKIKNFLNRQRREFLIEKGKEELDHEINTRHLNLTVTDKEAIKFFENKGVKSLEDLYYEIGKNVISPIGAINLIIGKPEITEQDLLDKYSKEKDSERKKQYLHSDINVIVEGLDKPSVKLANCCNPILGDEIVGYITKSSGIVVHRKECKNLENFDTNRLIDVYWGNNTIKKYITNLRINVLNRDNILAEIINAATSSKAKIVQVSAQSNDIKEGIIRMKIEVGSVLELDNVIVNIQRVKNVYSIERLG